MEAWLWSIHSSWKKATAVILCLVDPQSSLRTLSPHSFYHKIIYILPLILKISVPSQRLIPISLSAVCSPYLSSVLKTSSQHHRVCFLLAHPSFTSTHHSKSDFSSWLIRYPLPCRSAVHLAASLGTSKLPAPPSHGPSAWLTACLGRQKLLLVSDSFSVFTGLGTNLGTQPENVLTEVNFASVTKPA